jgi:hypothetical protein
MCHHRDYRTEWDRADDEEPAETDATADPDPDPDYEAADDVEILTDGGDGDDDAE